MSNPKQSRQTTDEYVKSLLDEGPDAVAQAIHQRDAIIVKLMYKLGVKEIRLHATDDPPDMRTRFGTSVRLDPNNDRVVILTAKHAEDYEEERKRSLN